VRKPLLSLVIVLLLSLTLAACGGGEEGTTTAETPDASPAAGPVDIDFWHSEAARNQDAINRRVDRFNASQNEVRVHASYQGSYSDTMAKLVASLPTGNVPAVALLESYYMQMVIDSGGATPIQDFVDRDDYDLSDLDEKGVESYTSQGKLWAMGLGSGVPLLYYNKVVFREVGLDPERPPRDLEEVRQYSQKILKRDAAGNVVRSGIALDIQEWVTEKADLLVDNDNGHDGRATKVVFNNDTSRWFFQWWHDMVDEGLAFNIGRNLAYAEGFKAIVSGRAAMTISYAGALRSVIDAFGAGQQNVEIGISPLPGVPGGTGQAGFSTFGLWILNVRPKDEQEAAWKFIKWLMEPEQQAEWFAGSGYLPVSRSAVNLQVAQDIVAHYPAFQVAIDLYLNTPANPGTEGAVLGPFEKVREAIYRGVEEMLSGVKDPDQALEDAAANANQAIDEYNRRVEE